MLLIKIICTKRARLREEEEVGEAATAVAPRWRPKVWGDGSGGTKRGKVIAAAAHIEPRERRVRWGRSARSKERGESGGDDDNEVRQRWQRRLVEERVKEERESQDEREREGISNLSSRIFTYKHTCGADGSTSRGSLFATLLASQVGTQVAM